jgi:hypothetical protein
MSAPAPVSVVEMDLKTYVKFLVDQLSAEQLEPMRREIGRLTQAVMGNGVPPLATQIANVDKKHDELAEALHARITNLRVELVGKPPDPEEKKNTETRLMLKGAWMGIGAASGIVVGLIELGKTVAEMFHH